MLSNVNASNTVAIPPVSTHMSMNNNSVVSSNTHQLHLQAASVQNNINNNNNTTLNNTNNGVKKKRFSVNVLNVKASGVECPVDIEEENITPIVKEELPWQSVNEAIQEITTDYAVDQSCKSHSTFNLCFSFSWKMCVRSM